MVSSITARVNFNRSISGAPLTPTPLPRPPIAPASPGSSASRYSDQNSAVAVVSWPARIMVATSSPSCSSVKRCAGLGIARGVHQVEQVARRRVRVLAGGAAFGHQHARRTASSACGSARGQNPAGVGQLQRQQQIENMRPRQPRAILHHEIAQRRAVASPSRTRTWCARRSRASSAASPRADRPAASLAARAWRWSRRSPRSYAEPASITARGVKAGASVRR